MRRRRKDQNQLEFVLDELFGADKNPKADKTPKTDKTPKKVRKAAAQPQVRGKKKKDSKELPAGAFKVEKNANHKENLKENRNENYIENPKENYIEDAKDIVKEIAEEHVDIKNQDTKNQDTKNQDREEISTSLNGGFMDYKDEDIVKILVVGVGGAGNNVVNRIVMESSSDRLHSYSSIRFVIVNTDKQALLHSNLENKILIGESTKGQGAGSDPEKGRKAAEESEAVLSECVAGMDMVFVTAGMGGGTGTGASPVIARLAKEAGALVVAVVSTPFKHEGSLKYQKALDGIEKLKEYADALIIIDNNKLVSLSNKKLSFANVFALADVPLKDAILGIAGTVLEYGNEMNTDFSDIRAIMENKGLAHMAVGSSSAEEGAGIEATKKALEVTLTNTSIRGATGVVFKIQSSDNLGFDEFNEMIELVASQCAPDVLMKHGKHSDDSLGNEVRVTIIATGVRQNNQQDFVKTPAPSLTFGKTPTIASEEPKKTGLNIPKGFR